MGTIISGSHVTNIEVFSHRKMNDVDRVANHKTGKCICFICSINLLSSVHNTTVVRVP